MEIWQEIDKWIDFTNDYIILNIIGVAFTIQIIYILFFFVKPKKYKVSEKKHRFAIVIPARNESAVIGDTIKCLLAQKYPRELFDIYVVADNCTDNTAEIARAAGATVYERFEIGRAHV